MNEIINKDVGIAINTLILAVLNSEGRKKFYREVVEDLFNVINEKYVLSDIAEEEYLRQYSKGWDDGVKDALKDIKAIHEKYKDRDLDNILPIVTELWQAIATTVKNVRG